MKIEFIVDDNPLYVLPFFDEFLRHYADTFPISQISLCPPMGKRSRRELFRQLTALYGPIGICRVIARLVRARILGVFPRSRGARHFDTMTQICKAYDIPCRRIGNPNHDEFRNDLTQRAPDLLVSVACPYILKSSVLAIPPMGCINIHHAPLPKYKGMMPTFWQLFHNESSVGVTIHQMNAAVDEGHALLQAQMDIEPNESLDHLITRAKRHGAHCMARVFQKLLDGDHSAIALESTESSYFTFPTTEQMLDFRNRGLRVL